MSSMIEISDAERRIAERVNPSVTQELAVSGTGTGVAFSNVGEMMEFAKMMSVANSGVRKHLRGNPGACLAILTQALEWGLSPFAVANKCYFVNDQIAFESQLVQAVILKRAPIVGRIKFRFSGEGDARRCIASATLADSTGEVEYESPPFGKIQPKNSPLWKNDPDQQHCYYSGRALCRRHFPDVLLGIYVDDDLGSEAQGVGADKARDVTPKGISAKLDALAAGPDSSALSKKTDTDSDLGAEDRTSRSSDASNGSDWEEHREGDRVSRGDDLADDQEGDAEQASPADALLARLRSEVVNGKSAPSLLNALTDQERALLTDDDRKSLRDMGRAIAAQKNKGGSD